jgi:hypothetical protein
VINKVIKNRLFVVVVLAFILFGCSLSSQPAPTLTSTAQPISTLPQPQVETTNVPDPSETARVYLDHWKAEEYSAMYGMLTHLSQDAISEDDFTARYKGVANEAALSSWDYNILSSIKNPSSGQVGYKVILHSVLVGDIQSETEPGRWPVAHPMG